MTIISKANQAAAVIRNRVPNFIPKIGIILGSGLNLLADQIQGGISISYSDLPGFSEASVLGHKGTFLFGHLNGIPVACMQGRFHYYEGHDDSVMLTPIRTLRLLGCQILILTNAAASLREEVQPGSLVMINDHINFQFRNPLIGPNVETFGTRFPSLQNAYDEDLRIKIKKTADLLNIPLYEGVYLATLGPTYETPAEIRAFRLLGADVVGMSTVPEVLVARHCQLKVVCISTITNMGSGMSDEQLTHENVLKVAHEAAEDLSKLIYTSLPAL